MWDVCLFVHGGVCMFVCMCVMCACLCMGPVCLWCMPVLHCVCVYVCAYIHTHTYEGQRRTPGVLLRHSPSYFHWGRVSHWTRSSLSLISVRLTNQQAPLILHSFRLPNLQNWGYMSPLPSLISYVGSRNGNAGPYACMASSLITWAILPPLKLETFPASRC